MSARIYVKTKERGFQSYRGDQPVLWNGRPILLRDVPEGEFVSHYADEESVECDGVVVSPKLSRVVLEIESLGPLDLDAFKAWLGSDGKLWRHCRWPPGVESCRLIEP